MDKQLGLFPSNNDANAPLAHMVRPKDLENFIGQKQIRTRIEHLDLTQLPHLIFHGPPGCGKTTLALALSSISQLKLYQFNAVLGGVNELRKIIQSAIKEHEYSNQKSIIFIDEIHRFNKSQQDALLPYLEKSDFILFGATTENPNTSLNKAILSRVQRWPLYALSSKEILAILENATSKLETLSSKEEIFHYIANHSNGDARHALNQLEIIIQNIEKLPNMAMDEIIKQLLMENRSYDRNQDRHYDVISAFIKSVRGSDVDAAILWLAIMLDGGEDIEFIARRLIILASEDIGNADPRALQVATSAHYAIKNIGMPEARIILSQATTYLANAPKSNASYLAIDKALDFIRNNPTIEVPTHLRNHHPNKEHYKYPHNYNNHWTEQQYSPLKTKIYHSSRLGYERMQDDYISRIKNTDTIHQEK